MSTNSRDKIRSYGSARGELIVIDPRLISFRLANGDFIGPRIGLHDDGKMHVLPNETPLTFSQDLIESISGENGWNTRVTYDLELIKELADKILASGVIYQPLHLIADGDRLFPMDGHRRVLAWLLLASQGTIIPNVLAIIKPLIGGLTVRDLEYQMLSYGTDSEKLSVYDKAKLIRRHLHEDRLTGLDEDQSRQQFCDKTGWKKPEYDRTLEISSMSAPTLKAIEGKVSETTLHNLVRKNDLTLSEKENVLLETVAIAEKKGVKATGQLVESVTANFIESKNPSFLDPDGSVKPSDELEPKPVKRPPKAKEVKYLLMTLVNEGNARHTDNNTMTVDFPKELWGKVIDFVERLS
jgi:hypothetical protein|uniref:ParB/Sulfiredoxin domain-containing protein n=1 Tax=Bacteriophage sp. TaxID=38018 RepID=A0A7G9A4I6_9VIRU|nr:MAG: hypothetical protein [Bacteriophage sp.]